MLPAEPIQLPDAGDRDPSPRPLGPWLPLALLTAAFLVLTGYQTFQLVRERGKLRTVRANQEAPFQQAQRVRAQLDSIARSTLELAKQGNSGAAVIVEQLARRGITINPNAPPPAAPTAEKK